MNIKRSKSIDLVMQYMEIFYSGEDLERLFDILAEDLIFEGPYYQFNSAKDYVESLISSPPVDCDYEIINRFEQGKSVNLIYWFSKPGVRTMMSQLFEIENNQIAKIILIFDTSKFTQHH